MKKLSQEQLLNLTDELAWEVAGSFADYLEHTKSGFLEFQNVLEYEKGDILVCLLYLLRKNSDNKELVEVVCSNIVLLEQFFIPSPEDYQKQLRLKENSDQLAK